MDTIVEMRVCVYVCMCVFICFHRHFHCCLVCLCVYVFVLRHGNKCSILLWLSPDCYRGWHFVFPDLTQIDMVTGNEGRGKKERNGKD